MSLLFCIYTLYIVVEYKPLSVSLITLEPSNTKSLATMTNIKSQITDEEQAGCSFEQIFAAFLLLRHSANPKTDQELLARRVHDETACVPKTYYKTYSHTGAKADCIIINQDEAKCTGSAKKRIGGAKQKTRRALTQELNYVYMHGEIVFISYMCILYFKFMWNVYNVSS